jgi:TP901 family phage tail tape measure protein
MADTGLNIKLYADDKEFKKSLKDLEAESKAAGKSFKTFSEQAKNLKGDDKVRAMSSALKALEQDLSATTSKAALLKNKLNEVGNDSKLGKSSELYRQLQKELEATENKASILKGKIAEIGSGKSEGALGGLTSALEKFGVSTDSVNTAVGVLVGKGLAALGKAALEAVQALGQAAVEAVKITAEFDNAMSAVQAFSGGSEADLSALKGTALELSATTKYTATEVANSMQVLAKEGWGTTEMQAGMKGVLDTATASQESVETAASVIVQSLNSFGAGAEQASHFGDVLTTSANSAFLSISDLGESMKYIGPLAGSMGLSLEDVNTALVALAENGIKGGQGGTTLRSFISRLSADTDGALEKFKELTGESAFDSSGNMRSLTDLFNSLRTAMQGYTAQEQAVIAKNLAGERGFSGLLAILNKSEDAYESLGNTIENSAGATERANDTMMDNLKGDYEILQSNIEKLQIDFGKMFTPMLRGLTQFATGAVQTIDGIFDKSNIAIIEETKKSLEDVDAVLKEADALEFSIKFPELSQETKEFNRNIAILEQAVGKNWDALSSTEQNNLKKAIEDLSGIYPAFTGYVDEATGAINLQADGFKSSLENAKEYYNYLYQAQLIEATQLKRAELTGKKAELQYEKEDLLEVQGLIDDLSKTSSVGDALEAYMNIKINPNINEKDIEKITKNVSTALRDSYTKMTESFSGMGEEYGVSDLTTVMRNMVGGLSDRDFEDFVMNLYQGNVDAVKKVGEDAGLTLTTEFYKWMIEQVSQYSEGNSELSEALVSAFGPLNKELENQIGEIDDKQTGIDKRTEGLKKLEDQVIATTEAEKTHNKAMSEADTMVSKLENIIVEEGGKYKKIDILEPLKEGINKEGLGDLSGFTKTASIQLGKATEKVVSSKEISDAIAKVKENQDNLAFKGVTLSNGEVVNRQTLASWEALIQKSEGLTDAYMKQEGAAEGVVDANDDLSESSDAVSKSLEEQKEAAQKLNDEFEKLNKRYSNRSEAKQWADEQIQALANLSKQYDDYVNKVTKSLAWDAHKEYKPITSSDEGYVTMESQNKNLDDYVKHQTERNDLFEKYLPKLQEVAPQYAKQITDAIASGDEAAIQGYYENIRNTVEKQGEDTLFTLAKEQEDLLSQMEAQNREMAVMSAKANQDWAKETLKGRMSDDTKAQYEDQIATLKRQGYITEEVESQLKNKIAVLQALGMDLTDVVKNYLMDSDAWASGDNSSAGMIGWLDASITSFTSEARTKAAELGLSISEDLWNALQDAINSQDPVAIQQAVDNIFGAGNAEVSINADGEMELSIKEDPEAGTKAADAAAKTKEAAQAGVDSQPAEDITNAINSNTTVEPDPQATEKGAKAAEDAGAEVQQAINNNPQEVENKVKQNTTVNDGDIEDNTGDNTAVDVTKIVNVKEVPIISNKDAVDEKVKEASKGAVPVDKVVNLTLKPKVVNSETVNSVAQAKAKTETTTSTTQTEKVKRNVTVDTNIKTNIKGDKGEEVGSQFGQGIAKGIQSQSGSITGTASSVMNAAASSAGSGASSSGYRIGSFLGSGLASGINSQVGAVAAAAARLEAEAERVIRAKAQIASPSKVMKELGIFMAEGFALGMDEGTKKVVASGSNMVSTLINEVKPDETISKAQKIAKEFATSFKDELDKEIKKDNKDVLDSLVSSFDSNEGSKKRAESARSYSATVKKGSAAYKKAVTKEADEWEELASDVQAEIDKRQSKLDSNQDKIDENNKKLKKKGLSKKQKKKLKKENKKLQAKNDPLIKAQAQAEKEQQEYLNNAFIAAREEARAEAARKRIDDSLDAVDRNATLRRSTLLIQNGGKDASVLQELALASQEVTDAFTTMNAVLANPDATAEQRADAYNKYAEKLAAATKAEQARLDALIAGTAAASAAARTDSTIRSKGGPLTTAQELTIANNEVTNALMAQREVQKNSLATDEQRKQAAEAVANAYTSQYNAIRKMNAELIASAGKEADRAKISLEYNLNRSLTNTDLLSIAKNQLKGEEKSLDDLWAKADYTPAFWDEYYQQLGNINKARREQEELTKSVLEDQKSNAQEQLDLEKELYTYVKGEKLSEEEELGYTKKNIAVAQEWYKTVKNQGLGRDEELAALKEINSLTQSLKDAEKERTQEILDRSDKEIKHWKLIEEFNRKRKLTDEEELSFNKELLALKERDWQDLLSRKHEEEDEDKLLEDMVGLYDDINKAAEKYTQSILDDATKKTNKWRIETEFAQKSSLKGNQKIQKAQMELNELEESYQKLLRQSNATEDQKLEMMEKITSATEELHNTYRSMYQDIYRNMSIDKPFTAAEVRINETIENMESHITGLTDLMNARAAVVNRGLSDIALGYLNSLSPEEATNYFIELQNASDADFQKFNQTLTELALKEKEYSDIQQQTEEILTEKVANIAQAINQISTNGIKINGYYTGLANAGNSMQQATLNTAALEQGMTTMVTAMMGMSKKFDSMSGDLVTTLDDFSQEVASALNKVGISIDGREFGRIVRQYV